MAIKFRERAAELSIENERMERNKQGKEVKTVLADEEKSIFKQEAILEDCHLNTLKPEAK